MVEMLMCSRTGEFGPIASEMGDWTPYEACDAAKIEPLLKEPRTVVVVIGRHGKTEDEQIWGELIRQNGQLALWMGGAWIDQPESVEEAIKIVRETAESIGLENLKLDSEEKMRGDVKLAEGAGPMFIDELDPGVK
jgi:hypothetical protein